jgi:hypothetical protein
MILFLISWSVWSSAFCASAEFLDEPYVTSAGCLCLSRKIIQDKRVNFYPIIQDNASEDFSYYIQARNNGYKIYLDGTNALGHGNPLKNSSAWTFDSSTKQYVPFSYK